MSRIHFYSMGIVAENKLLNSEIVEVSPVEELPMIDGEITDHAEEHNTTNINKDGKQSSTTAQTTNTVPATWLPISGGNRVTPPDVRRGAVVMLYQMADEKKYYWTTLTNDIKLRKLETVLYAFSASAVEGAEVNGENYYYLEVSTHTKTVTFHTSKADGEPFSYDIQINAKEGKIVISDDIDNFILLDSTQKQIKIENTDGCFFEIIGKDGNMNIVNDLNITVGNNMNTKVGSNITSNAGTDTTLESGSKNTFQSSNNILDAPSNNVNGDLSVGAGRGGSPGNGQIQGRFDFLNDIEVKQKLTVYETESEWIKTPNPIDAPNVL